MWSRLLTLLADPRAPRVAAALGLALMLPLLASGFVLDDYLQILVLERSTAVGLASPHPLRDMFAFVPGTAENRAVLDGLGVTTWLAHPELKLTFWRPLSAATHMLDHSLWPRQALPQHLHSLLWWGAALWASLRLFRLVQGPGALLGLTALLFSIDDAHSLPAGWLANRNSSIALCFGALSLHAFIQSRRGELRHGLWASTLLYALALLAGESGIGTTAFLFAHQLCLDRGRWPARLLPLLPAGALTVAWRLLYNHLGYGAHGSTLYVDPVDAGLGFLPVALERGSWLLGMQLFQAPGVIWAALPPSWGAAAGLLWGLLALALGLWISPVLRSSATARFWSLSLMLALLPVSATFPMDRVLTFTSLAAFPLLAECFIADRGRILLIGHLPIAGLLLLLRLPSLLFMNSGAQQAIAAAEGVGQDQMLIFVQGLEINTAYVPVMRLVEGLSPPGHTLSLGPIGQALQIERIDERSLRLRPERGWLHSPGEGMMRDGFPFEVGQRIDRAGYSVEVRALADRGRPSEAIFTFDRPLEDPAHAWRLLVGQRHEHWTPPAQGEVVDVPPWNPFAPAP